MWEQLLNEAGLTEREVRSIMVPKHESERVGKGIADNTLGCLQQPFKIARNGHRYSNC